MISLNLKGPKTEVEKTIVELKKTFFVREVKKNRVISPVFPLPARAKVPCNHTLAYSHSASNSPVMKSNFPRKTLMSSHDPRLIIYGLTR